jgi:hypothetical protein
VAKKRRITNDQARFLAIHLINEMVSNGVNPNPRKRPPLETWQLDAFRKALPEKWNDGNTSEQSWDHVWLESSTWIAKIMGCLLEEAKQIQAENPEFRLLV